MLKQVRDGLKGIVAWFVIALLVLAFAAWGVPEIRNFTQRPPLRVGDTGFSANEIQAAFNRELVSRRLSNEGGYTREDAIAQGLPNEIVARMAAQAALEEEARRLGLAMPRDLVSNFLQTAEQFQNPRTGKFDNETLSFILQNYQMSAAEFERLMKSDLMRGQLIESIASGPGAPEAIARDILLREYEQRDVAYVTITEDMTGVAAEPTPDDLKTLYETAKSTYTAPEYRMFTVVMLRNEDFRDENEVTDELIEEYYERNKARLYEQPERRSVYQITYDAEAEALAAIASLENGEPFEDLATARGLPLDAVTFDNVTKADFIDPNVGEAAFAGESPDAVIGPVQGLFGYTVLQMRAITPEDTQTLEDVRDDIAAQLASGEERKRLFDAVEAIENQRDTGATLADAAASEEQQSERFGPVDKFSFAPGGAIIDGIPGEVINEAFALDEGEESQAIAFEDDSGYFFVAVDAVTAPAPIPYDEVADEVELLWRAEERDGRFAKAVAQVRDALAGGASLADAAGSFNAAPETKKINRDPNSGDFNPTLIEQIFTADKGAVVSGAVDDGRVVVVVNDISYDLPPVVSGQVPAVRQYLGVQYDRELLEAYAASVSQDVGVLRDEAALARVFSVDQ